MTDFRSFLPNGSAVWRAYRLTSGPHHHQTGGIALHGGLTRRRHAAEGLHVVQTPPSSPMWSALEGQEGLAAVPVGGGRAWLGYSQRPGPTGVEGAGGAGGSGCGARGRWQGLVGLRADAPSRQSAHQAPPVWRAPEGPEGTGGLRGAAPNEVRPPSLAGGRALRRPEHQRGHKQHHQSG